MLTKLLTVFAAGKDPFESGKQFSESLTPKFVALGLAIAVTVFVALGVWYIFAGRDKKAQIKDKLTQVVIGLIIVVGGSAFIGWVADFLNGSFGG